MPNVDPLLRFVSVGPFSFSMCVFFLLPSFVSWLSIIEDQDKRTWQSYPSLGNSCRRREKTMQVRALLSLPSSAFFLQCVFLILARHILTSTGPFIDKVAERRITNQQYWFGRVICVVIDSFVRTRTTSISGSSTTSLLHFISMHHETCLSHPTFTRFFLCIYVCLSRQRK